jgi:hypothetical protein
MRTLKDSIYETIHKNEKSLEQLAEEINVSSSYLTRSALPDKDESDTGTGCRLAVKFLVPLTRAAGNFLILDHIEASVGRVAFRLPSEIKSIPELHLQTMNIVKEFGHFMSEVAESAKDNDLSEEEKDRIAKEGYEAIQEITALLKAIGRISREK